MEAAKDILKYMGSITPPTRRVSYGTISTAGNVRSIDVKTYLRLSLFFDPISGMHHALPLLPTKQSLIYWTACRHGGLNRRYIIIWVL